MKTNVQMFRISCMFLWLLSLLSPLTMITAATIVQPSAEAVPASPVAASPMPASPVPATTLSASPSPLPGSVQNVTATPTAPPVSAVNNDTEPILEFVTLENSVVQVIPQNKSVNVVPPTKAQGEPPQVHKDEKEDEEKQDDDAAVIEDAKYWHKVGMAQLKKTIKRAVKDKQYNYRKKAKNIIVFIGDGMGLTTISAGRIYKGQYLKHNGGEEETLAFDDFPYTGLAKTYNVDMQVPDSAGTATAIFSGSKTQYGAVGMDMTRNQTDSSRGRLSTIMDWAQAEGKRTGIVTTTRITHATPSATYARIYHRDWECDTKVPPIAVGKHADIARQLVENAPGNRFNVILGGGSQPMGAPNVNERSTMKYDGSTETPCSRADKRNLTQEWLELDSESDGKRVFVQNAEQLKNLDYDEVDHLMGLFRNNHITYSITRQEGEPSLKEMTEAAIKVLQRGDEGFVLMVEGGRIDMAHHQNYARTALHEVLEFDMAVEAAVEMTDDSETLILVTADHSHSFTFNGYGRRGNDILGFANKPVDLVVYEALSYANGPGYWDHLQNSTASGGSGQMWIPLEQFTAEQRAQPTYRHMATVARDDESHGGEDVVVFAQGPGASLVGGTFEQNYLAFVMSYAGCMGPAKDYDNTCRLTSRSGAIVGRTLDRMAGSFLLLLLVNVF